jgi:uncharacterized membrane protein
MDPMTATDDTDTARPAEPRVPTAADRYQSGAFLAILISGVIGLWASFVLSVDAIALAEDPLADLSCNISEKISCAVVGTTWQANLLGFPNAFFGLIGQTVVITIAVAALGGVRFPRWFMVGAELGFAAGLAFAFWLFAQSFFVIDALCPWCTVLYVTTLVSFAALTRINILEGNLGAGTRRRLERPLRLGMDTFGVLLLLGALAAMIVYKYV